MKSSSAFLLVLATVSAGSFTRALGAEEAPAWAYPINPPNVQLPPDDGVPRRVPDSNATFSLTQIRYRHFSPDWHPEDHPPLPEPVARGKVPEVPACGFCHRAEGTGGPENANLAGQPLSYLMQQVRDFKSGARRSSVPKRNVDNKITMFNDAADADMETALAYFSALKPKKVIVVTETDTVPKTYVTNNHLADAKTGEKEPLGQRIIEVPEDLDRFTYRDSRVRFIAYAPVGSVAKGKALAATGGNGKTQPCSTCHGPELKGLGPIPRIAGLSPSYIVRQLYDFQHGSRNGPSAPLMKGAVEKLTLEDIVALAAYASSLAP